MDSRISREQEKGFTLIELLVTSGMIVFIGLAIYKTLTSGISMYEDLEATRPRNDAVIFLDRVASDIRNYCMMPDVKFQGAPDRISFYVHDSRYSILRAEDAKDMSVEHMPPVYRVEYVFDTAGGRMIRRAYAFGGGELLGESTVLSGVGNAVFSFAIRDDADQDKGTFRERAGKEPEAVKVEVRMGRGSGPSADVYRIIEIDVNAV